MGSQVNRSVSAKTPTGVASDFRGLRSSLLFLGGSLRVSLARYRSGLKGAQFQIIRTAKYVFVLLSVRYLVTYLVRIRAELVIG